MLNLYSASVDISLAFRARRNMLDAAVYGALDPFRIRSSRLLISH